MGYMSQTIHYVSINPLMSDSRHVYRYIAVRTCYLHLLESVYPQSTQTHTDAHSRTRTNAHVYTLGYRNQQQ